MAQIVRVFTKDPTGVFSDDTFPAGDTVRVVAEIEARTAEILNGIAFSAGAVCLNLTTLAISLPAPQGNTPAYGAIDHMNTPAWPAEAHQLEYDIPAAFGAANDICMVFFFLKIGAAVPFDAYFAFCQWMRT
jgi:hypothetical protein